MWLLAATEAAFSGAKVRSTITQAVVGGAAKREREREKTWWPRKRQRCKHRNKKVLSAVSRRQIGGRRVRLDHLKAKLEATRDKFQLFSAPRTSRGDVSGYARPVEERGQGHRGPGGAAGHGLC